MSLLTSLKGGGRHGVASTESRDPIGIAVAALNRLAQNPLLDRFGVRRQTEQTVFTLTRGGFALATAAGRRFERAGRRGAAGVRSTPAVRPGVFDLTPTEDEQMLLDVAREFAAEVIRPAAAEANETCVAPPDVLKGAADLGLPVLGLPESLGGVYQERSAIAGVLVTEALSHGDLGLTVAALGRGAVATALGLWGTDAQQQTYLEAFASADAPAAALALLEPGVLFDVLEPATTLRRERATLVLSGTKTLVSGGAEAELFVVGAEYDGQPVLVLVEAGTEGLSVEAEPAMGVRAASLTTLHLDQVRVDEEAILGAADGTTYRECVRLSRLAWCALAVGTSQAVLDYVTPYVKSREAFGEPIAHRQAVAFSVADMATEIQAMRLLTWKAASRVAQGIDATREIALAHRLCVDKAMRIGLDGVQLLGGHGFVKEHPVERWYRDLRAIGVMEGTVLV